MRNGFFYVDILDVHGTVIPPGDDSFVKLGDGERFSFRVRHEKPGDVIAVIALTEDDKKLSACVIPKGKTIVVGETWQAENQFTFVASEQAHTLQKRGTKWLDYSVTFMPETVIPSQALTAAAIHRGMFDHAHLPKVDEGALSHVSILIGMRHDPSRDVTRGTAPAAEEKEPLRGGGHRPSKAAFTADM
jgi:hypothetical protein